MADSNSDQQKQDSKDHNDSGKKSGGDAAAEAAMLTGKLMSNPLVLSALQSKLNSMVGESSGYIESLPKPVKRRVKALKKMQKEYFTTEARFYEEVHELEMKYANLYGPLYRKRESIINGDLEPTDSDCDWPSDDEEEEEKEEDVNGDAEKKQKLSVEDLDEPKTEKQTDNQTDDKADDSRGIEEFWLTIFKNVDVISDMIKEHDEPILKHLKDIRVVFLPVDNMGFRLEFVFETNDYFTNTVLTKEYFMRVRPTDEHSLHYEGPEIYKSTGCHVDWKQGKNVTVKVVKKSQKSKGKGSAPKKTTKVVKNESFFNFFSPPAVTEDEELDEETEAALSSDFEVGHLLQQRIIPRAVLYFTGEGLDDDNEYDDDDEDDDDENYDENEDPDYEPPAGQQNPGECKQQ